MLPDLAETLLVLDEAHGLPAKAVEHCTARHSLKGAQVWIERAAALAEDATTALHLNMALAEAVAAASLVLDERMEELNAAIGVHCRFEGQETVWRCPHGILPDHWREIGVGLAQAAAAMAQALQALREAMVATAGKRPALSLCWSRRNFRLSGAVSSKLSRPIWGIAATSPASTAMSRPARSGPRK